LPHGD